MNPVMNTLPADPYNTQYDARQRVAQALLNAGTGGAPVSSWAQGLADLASAGIGGAMMRGANWNQGIGATTANAAPLDIRPRAQGISGLFNRITGAV